MMRDEVAAQPFDGLEPGVVLDAVEAHGARCNGRLLALNSFENRVYQVGLDDGRNVVAKFYRPERWSNEAILEEHQFSLELKDFDIPVVAPLQDNNGATLLEYRGFRYAVYPSVGGNWPELTDAEDRRRIGRLVGRIHAVSSARQFEHRPSIDVQTLGYASVEAVLQSQLLSPGREQRYRDTCESLLTYVTRHFSSTDIMARIRLHGDLHRGNILWADNEVNLVDLDDCSNGPAIQDLWMLADSDGHTARENLFDIVEGYETFHEFDWRQVELVESLRSLRLVYHAAWLARRWHDPAFPRAFPWFGSEAYWTDHLNDLQAQLAKLEQGVPSLH